MRDQLELRRRSIRQRLKMEGMGEDGIETVERLETEPAVEEEKGGTREKKGRNGPTKFQPAKPRRHGAVLRAVEWG